MKTITVLLLLLTAAAGYAQEVSVGSLYPLLGTSYSIDSPLTMVNLSAPATGNGTVSTVTLTWRTNNGLNCSSSFKIRFFRKGAGNIYTATDTRGPFNSKEGQITLPLS